jgi:hypothetical protein
LFAPAGENHLVIGEASVWYLYSKLKSTEFSPNLAGKRIPGRNPSWVTILSSPRG